MAIQEPIVEAATLSEAKRRLLAQRLKGASPARAADRIQPRPPGARNVISPDQYSVWLDTTLQPDLPTYNEIVTIRYRGEIDPVLLQQSFNAYLARTELWRSTFAVDQGEVLQIVQPELRLEFNLIDLSAFAPAEAEAESNRLATEAALLPFDLEQLPLIRPTLVRLSPGDCRLHLCLAHLIFDGFSLRRTFLPELIAVYEALEAGRQLTLPPLELQYADYCTWRLQQCNSPAMQAHLDFWRQNLSGDLPLLRLPSDRPRPAVITHRGNIARFNIPHELVESLRKVGLPLGASFYMTLMATFKALLFRYSGQQDIVIGSVADGRHRPELESMMGYMLDVFAVRTQPSASLPFTDYLKQLRLTVLDGLAHAEAPFERVVEALGAKRDLSHQPIFQTLFIIEPTPQPNGLWDIAASEISIGATKIDLYVEADEHPTHTAVSIDYSTDLFDPETIQRMIGHWTTIMEAVSAAPNLALGDLPILTPGESETLLVRWNQTAVTLPVQTMHGLIEDQVRLTPNAPAVSFESTTFTYAELDREAIRLAHHLRLAGAAPDTLIAVFLDRSQYLQAALLAVLKTGAAYLPLDPATPAARVALCLEDGASNVILTNRARVTDLPTTSATILILEDLLSEPYPADFTPTQVSPEALAYVIHTSGSTGRPKGVELRHAGVVNLLLSMQREPGFTAADTLVAVTTVSFDIAVLELFLPLITGGRVVIASRETALDPTRLAALIESSAATVLQATPATWSALLSIHWQGPRSNPARPGLKAICGGEALNRSLADRLLALGLDLWNVYGPTETTIWSTVQHVSPGAAAIPVGRPIANTSAYILDIGFHPVPVNVPGELFLGGRGLARGYRNKPELTREKFLPNPFSTHNGQRKAENSRLYRTGDYALFRADGSIEVQGRADNQVKIRGFRIELEDVEVNLTAHPEVAFAAARAWPDPDNAGSSRLCAYLVGVAGPPPGAADLRHFLRGRVADYMIPSDIVALPSMPLTANGKIDRNQLRPPDRTASVTPAPGSTLTGDELRLAHIWAELLHVDNIAATDNFFDLGGHSLMLLKLIRLINKEFSVDLPMTRLFQAPTIEKLARVIDELAHPQSAMADQGTLVPLNPHGARRPFFLIHSVLLYGRLPAALGHDQPVYGLEPLPFDDTTGDDWVEAMLEDHIAQIKRVQPRGPYQIAGWCFAGLLAYEVARRLEAAGDKVSMLALFDSWNPSGTSSAVPILDPKLAPLGAPDAPDAIAPLYPAPQGPAARLRSLLWKVEFRSRQFIRLNAAERGGHIRRMFRDLFKTLLVFIKGDFMAAAYRFCTRFNLPGRSLLHDPWVVTYEWMRRYRVQPYTGNIALLRPADIAVPPQSDPCCGWRTFTSGQIHTTFIPGDRSTMFLGKNLSVLAGVLRRLMDSAPTSHRI